MTQIEQYRKALILAQLYHGDQLRIMGQYEGKSYFEYHILPVCRSVATYPSKTLAALHDIIEDTSCTYDFLEAAGFSPIVIKRLELLTRTDERPYKKYIQRIAESNDRAVIEVKIADIINNLSQSTSIGHEKRYAEALAELLPVSSGPQIPDNTLYP